MAKDAGRVFSGIQPTGMLHVGNYFGAVRRWAELDAAEGDRCLFCIVDYHAITSEHDAARLGPDTLRMAGDLLACGVGKRGLLFVQSHVPEHTELAWILASATGYGDLGRMTQFKDKSGDKDFVSAALFTYPVLMAADILAYRAARVPVGEDQLQHLELARSIARRFNQRYGEYFPEPAPIMSPAARLMSLADPTRKMSKSAGERHVVGVFEQEAAIRSKIRSAVTATEAGQAAPGVRNLLLLLRQCDAARAEHFEKAEAAGTLRYAELKDAVADALLAALGSAREARRGLSDDAIRRTLAAGAGAARRIAAETLAETRRRIGLLAP